MIMGTTIFYGAFLVLMNFVVDIVYGFIDPRIRIAK
jgi:ABC-type dipeptide/oligopeptide/nickel transport system permease component